MHHPTFDAEQADKPDIRSGPPFGSRPYSSRREKIVQVQNSYGRCFCHTLWWARVRVVS